MAKAKTFISDEEMEKLSGGAKKFISDEEMERLSAQGSKAEQPGLLSKAFAGYDKYVSGPSRAFAKGNMQGLKKGDAPLAGMPITATGLKAAYDQFGKEGAPTGGDINREVVPGYDKLPEWAQAGGDFATEVATDPLTYAPVGAALKGAARVGGKVLAPVGRLAKSGAIKAGSELTGLSPENIRTYIDDYDKVQGLIKKFPGVTGVADAANSLKEGISSSVDRTRQALGRQIDRGLKAFGSDKTVSASPALKLIDDAIAKLDPDFEADKIAELAGLRKVAGSKGADLSVEESYKLKQLLQDSARPSYVKDGAVMQRGNYTASSAKRAAGQARETFREATGATKGAGPQPAAAAADDKLTRLNRLSEMVGKRVLKKDSATGIVNVSRNNRSSARKALGLLGDEIDRPELGKELDRLSAFEAFRSPGWVPQDSTGKTVARMGLLGGAGYFAGDVLPDGPDKFGAALGLLASPTALKLGIQGAKGLGALGRGAAGMVPRGAAEGLLKVGAVGGGAARRRYQDPEAVGAQ